LKNPTIGILAHVDAGKTTLSESMLYHSNVIRKLGRVDHKDSYLDNYEIEKERGITIFSKSAVISFNNIRFTLIDTPGHIDFSPETERTLQILDYAILIIDGSSDIKSHTRTLSDLLKEYKIPFFIFINKMDMSQFSKQEIIANLKETLDINAIDFDDDSSDDFFEQIAVSDEKILENYLETNSVNQEQISNLISERKIIPCYSGSALKLQGTENFLLGIEKYTKEKKYPDEFGARVYKISKDKQGNKLTFMKITGGTLTVKDTITLEDCENNEVKEKINQIRIYSGFRYESVNQAESGTICAVAGLVNTFPGQGIGFETERNIPILKPVLRYKIDYPSDINVLKLLDDLKELGQEEPSLSIEYNEKKKEINANIWGNIQIEILKRLIKERYDTEVDFVTPSVLYKETIKSCATGQAHYEPLRHYAEVHLKIEPTDDDKISFESRLRNDNLDIIFYKAIKREVLRTRHKGVLTGSDVTGIKVILIAAKSHVKHSCPLDFAMATRRAIRCALRNAQSVLCEPYYRFRLSVPVENTGRALSDMAGLNAEFESPITKEDVTIIKGTAPCILIDSYMQELDSYTKGKGKFFLMSGGYKPCHNFEEVIEKSDYDVDSDTENSADSVFCKNGGAFLIKWNEAKEYMHIDVDSDDKDTDDVSYSSQKSFTDMKADEEELRAIFAREFGSGKQVPRNDATVHGKGFDTLDDYVFKESKQKQECLLVDGYNIIFSWKNLADIANDSIGAARDKLIEIMSNYQPYRKCILIVVFDAYKVSGHKGTYEKHHNINIVYTKEAQTADMYIEKTTAQIADKYIVRVATSDALEQMIILGRGASRISAREFEKEVNSVTQNIRDDCERKSSKSKVYLVEAMSDEIKNIGKEK
jgi:small GTP-binding protein